MKILRSFGTPAALAILAMPAMAAPLVSPGDLLLRHDLQLLNDSQVISTPITTWPVDAKDLRAALIAIDRASLIASQQASASRLLRATETESRRGRNIFNITVNVAKSPSSVRAFHAYPRDRAELSISRSWALTNWSLNLRATSVVNANDGDSIRPDGTYVGRQLGNWLLTAGWQDRWWGPGMNGSLILSSNARPFPAVEIQRRRSAPAESPWFSWAGPWTLTTFLGYLDDDRSVDNALLFGIRGTIRPHQRLEIGLSRTAQWCGRGRPCSASTLSDLLLGRDNRGVNVDPADEPGNQLGGIDFRWTLPGKLPIVAYAQWIAEDSRRGGPEIGSWLRLAGVEFRGGNPDFSHNTSLEIAETSCRDGGLGFSELVPDCGYEHPIYSSGYRYKGSSLGHGLDSDGLSYSLQTTLVQSSEQFWTFSVRHMQVNRSGSPDLPHSLAMTPVDITDAELSVRRATKIGIFTVGIGLRRIDRTGSDVSDNKITGLLQWSLF